MTPNQKNGYQFTTSELERIEEEQEDSDNE